jgi:hypothetical protein
VGNILASILQVIFPFMAKAISISNKTPRDKNFRPIDRGAI